MAYAQGRVGYYDDDGVVDLKDVIRRHCEQKRKERRDWVEADASTFARTGERVAAFSSLVSRSSSACSLRLRGLTLLDQLLDESSRVPWHCRASNPSATPGFFRHVIGLAGLPASFRPHRQNRGDTFRACRSPRDFSIQSAPSN